MAVSVWTFLGRVGTDSYRNETHDHRSATAYGTAKVIVGEEEYIHGMSVLCRHTGRPAIKKITTEMHNRLLVLRITCDYASGKTQYVIDSVEDIAIPKISRTGKPIPYDPA